MRTKSIATVSAVLIGLGGAALAQQTAPAGSDTLQPSGQAQTDATGTAPLVDDPAQPATGMGMANDPAQPAPGGDLARDPMQPAPGGDVAEKMDGEPITGQSSRSYATSTEPFTGSVMGGLSAEELIGMDVVDSTGETIGTVSDLLIGADDTVTQAIVDIGGFLGFGGKTTAIDLERATVAEGDGELVVDMTREQIDALPNYKSGDAGWSVVTD